MKMEKPEKNYLKYIYIITGVFIFCFLVFYVIFGESYFNQNNARINKINQFEITGTYQSIGDDTVYNFDDYSDIEAGKDGVIITGMFNGYLKCADDLIVFVSNMQISIYANDNLIYESKDEEITRYDIVSIRKSIEDGAEIRIELIPLQGIYYTYTYQNFFENLYIGDTYALTLMKVKNNLPLIIFCIIIMISGLITIVEFYILKHLKEPILPSTLSCGALMFVSGFCASIDYDFITLLFPNYYIISILDTLSELLICQFLLTYLHHFIVSQKRKVMAEQLIVIWSCAIIFYYPIKYITGASKLFINGYYIVLIIILFVLMSSLIIWDHKKIDSVNNRKVIWSINAFFVSLIVELIHYAVSGYFFIYAFIVGVFLFCVLQLYVVIDATHEKIRGALMAEKLEKEATMQLIKNKELEKELEKSKTAVMLSQIRPHFLYNALGVIRVLIGKEPKVAKKAIENFTFYLRANMDALTDDDFIMFNKELDHVKSYLYIEQLRFGEELKICYDIKADNFLIPPLSLQTIVENAVKHGIHPKRNGGTVTIKTLETSSQIIIIVEDDGVGFDVTTLKDNDTEHIGVVNTRKRIEELCKGTFVIESTYGMGTKVTIMLPKEI